jgi:hypothetical protein
MSTINPAYAGGTMAALSFWTGTIMAIDPHIHSQVRKKRRLSGKKPTEPIINFSNHG